MDILVEKLDGSRYYLSQYKVLITDFEESAPSVTRNSKQLDQRNGNIDFGGWHTDKTINITGYYRADDIDEEETLREKLYALLSDPNGYYITQLKTTPSVAMERPGDTSDGYYDKLNNYPSHKRFLVYTEAPEMELVGNINGTLLYKITAEFKTIKLPYGETPAVDVAIDSPHKYVPVNLLAGTSQTFQKQTGGNWSQHDWGWIKNPTIGNWYTISCKVGNADHPVSLQAWSINDNGVRSGNQLNAITIVSNSSGSCSFVWPDPKTSGSTQIQVVTSWTNDTDDGTYEIASVKAEEGKTASPWSPNPADPEYNSWYYSNVSIPYSGSVPCNQLEQGFTIQFTATSSASSLSFKINDTELTYSKAVATGDVFMFSGFSYTQNRLSIVSKTNKAYFILQPDKPNRITCNVHGTVKIIGFQNLYA